MTPEEIKELATKTFKEQVFFSSMVPVKDSSLLGSIFMPLMLMNEQQTKQFKTDKVAAVYEYYDKAGPRAINGYPMFMTMHTITEPDLKAVVEQVKKLHDAVKDV